MEGSPYRKFPFSRGKGAVPGTGPGVLRSVEPGYLLVGTQRPVFCLGSGEIQYLILRSSDDHIDSAATIVIALLVLLPCFSPDWFPWRVLRLRGLIVSWRAVRIIVEIFYARHFGKFSVSSFAANLAPRTLQFTIDLGCGASSVMDLRFHCSNFCDRFHEMIAKIANLRFLASRFPPLSAFAEFAPRPVLPVRPRR
ncbi:hypothetical protein F2Q68_00010546 [Brassica cretica]|uniref:Uncharacterized protein n=1 Tax=Brassica cretica TaxID=69181 RepID=A0A8S9KXH0_BRACR|nr:hypothetical protein F2Q68_00010546 [Brassica cretica]